MAKNNVILIPVPEFFSFTECLWFLNRNYDDCLHQVTGNEVRKALLIQEQVVLISVKQQGAFLSIELLQGPCTPAIKKEVTQYVADWFDIERDMTPFYALLQKDKKLAYMAEAYKGLRLLAIDDLFEVICWAITGQQINLSFAYKCKRRLVEQYGSCIEYENQVYHLFPSYEVLATASKALLKQMQFSEQKANYIIGIANDFKNGILSKALVQQLPLLEERRKLLISRKGIGIWTANYALMKSLKEHSCIPHGDVGLLKALVDHGVIQERTETDKIERFFKKYKGWESYVVFYLWRSLSSPV